MPLTTVNSPGILDGSITNADIADGEIQGGKLATTIDLPNGATATTQPASDNSTKIATTEYVDREVGALSQDLISTDVTQSASRTFADNQNHAMVGPMTLNSGVVFTIGSGSKLVILN